MTGPTLRAASGDDAATPALLKLQTFLSPAFPAGSFAYSHGLEWLIESGAIKSAASLRLWLEDILAVGSLWNEAVLFAVAHAAAQSQPRDDLFAVAELAEAMAASRERHLESLAQGRAFAEAVSLAWPTPSVDALVAGGSAPYAVAVAAATADHAIPVAVALPSYLNAFTANLVSVAVRLVPVGQSEGLAVLAALQPRLVATANRALESTLDDLGSATILADIASMRHETQYSRVFRT